MKRFCARLLLFALLLCGVAHAEVAFPQWTQPVIDLTGTLEPAQIQVLNERLAAFEARKGSQIGVLVLSTTQPETIEQLGIRVFDEWKLGRRGVDDGVLLLVAKDDDRWRIEVGYGLEGSLTDVAATRIARDVIFPHFKRGDYYAGIDAGVSAIAKIVDSEPLPPPTRRADSTSSNDPLGFMKFMGGFLILALLGITAIYRYTVRLKAGNNDTRDGGKSAMDRVRGDH
ncbi:MAG: YgcG family protein [Gallionella sp.]|nr:MAG: YgcG family protein [Gallionella sp.]